MNARAHVRTVRACRGCGSVVVVGRTLRYCEACQRQPQCPSCEKVGGGHLAWCTWSQPNRRPVPIFQGRITLRHFEMVYETTRPLAIRVAGSIVGRRDAEDAVQSAALYLYGRLDTLPYLTPHVFILSAKMKAIGLLQSAWHRRFMGFDPADLEMIERNLEGLRRGRPSRYIDVRLPEPEKMRR